MIYIVNCVFGVKILYWVSIHPFYLFMYMYYYQFCRKKYNRFQISVSVTGS